MDVVSQCGERWGERRRGSRVPAPERGGRRGGWRLIRRHFAFFYNAREERGYDEKTELEETKVRVKIKGTRNRIFRFRASRLLQIKKSKSRSTVVLTLPRSAHITL